MIAFCYCVPCAVRQQSKLIKAGGAVKDQREARPARTAGARNQEQNAIPTQNALRSHPVTLVHDQFRSASPHFQPARSTARIARPSVRS